jgi:glucose-induced degradation protein 8
MTQEKQKKIVSPEEWESRLSKIQIPKYQMNQLVMDYLQTEGFKEAAQNFQEECLIKMVQDESLEDRDAIRTAIYSNEIDKAIQLLQTLYPTVLASNPNLYFSLQIQKLITFIKDNKIPEALAYGQEVLAPAAKHNPLLLNELEKALSLLAFNDITQSPLSEISTPVYKLKIANEVNNAILKVLNAPSVAKIYNMCKVLAWTQSRLEKHISFPVRKEDNRK